MSIQEIESAFSGFKKVCSNHKDQIATYQAIIDHLKEIERRFLFSNELSKGLYNYVRDPITVNSLCKKDCQTPVKAEDSYINEGFIPLKEFRDEYAYISETACQILCQKYRFSHYSFCMKTNHRWFVHPEKFIKILMKNKRYKNRHDQGIFFKEKGMQLYKEILNDNRKN